MDKRKAYETLTKLSAELLRGCEKTAPTARFCSRRTA